MAPSPIFEIMVIPARLIEVILYLLIAIYIKKRGRQGGSAFPLNNILFLAFIGGFFYSVCDNIIFLFAGLSFDPSIYLDISGYELLYPSLFLANVFRDIGMAGIILNIWSLFIASIEIKYGEAFTERKILKNKVVPAIILGVSSLIIGFDIIAVEISSLGTRVYALYSDVSGLIVIFTLTLYFVAAILFRRASVGAFTSDHEKQDNPLLFQRTKRFSTGLIVMGLGYLHAVTWGQLATIPEVLAFAVNIMILLNYVTHGLWILALVIIFSAIRTSSEKIEK